MNILQNELSLKYLNCVPTKRHIYLIYLNWVSYTKRYIFEISELTILPNVNWLSYERLCLWNIWIEYLTKRNILGNIWIEYSTKAYNIGNISVGYRTCMNGYILEIYRLSILRKVIPQKYIDWVFYKMLYIWNIWIIL